MATKTCGQFKVDDDGALYGPKAYMETQGNALVDRILAGEDAIFNLTCQQSPDLETAVVVRLQTDYAGWCGMQQVTSWLRNDSKA